MKKAQLLLLILAAVAARPMSAQTFSVVTNPSSPGCAISSSNQLSCSEDVYDSAHDYIGPWTLHFSNTTPANNTAITIYRQRDNNTQTVPVTFDGVDLTAHYDGGSLGVGTLNLTFTYACHVVGRYGKKCFWLASGTFGQ